jgi:peptidoglycan hydrolase CwlO-like protein
MKTEKQRLTRIINTVKEKFPDGNDIFGYSGITKERIIHSLENSYTFLGLLEEINNEIEIVWIKRKLAKYFDELSGILKEINTDLWIQKFDRFLDIIFEMRINVKEVYIALTDNPIRADEDIQKAKEQYNELHNACDSIATELETIKNGAEETGGLLDELETLKTGLTTANEEARKIIANITDIEGSANESSGTIEEVTPKITATFTELKELQKTLNVEADRINSMLANGEKNVERIKQREDVLQKQIEVDASLQKEIQQTLQDVNKHGMAGAFLKRKQELQLTAVLWAVLSIISMGVLIFFSYQFAIAVLNTSDDSNLVKHLFKIPSVIAGIWLCWFCAKQFGYTIRIREDYSYKYAISMAFEGYKNETREINKELLKKLLEVTVANISSNPIVLYNSKSNHGSPWHELTDGIKNFLKIDVKADVTADTKDLTKFS